MSRRVIIQGGKSCLLPHLVDEVIAKMHTESRVGLRFNVENKCFVYDGLDDNYRDDILRKAESLYGVKLQEHRARQIEANAKKHGFIAQKQKSENNKIKMVMVKRVYGR